ncbi:hypothetical protein BST96_11395 [Oceanicoccus sagamiensis]|uniref:Tetratricopeptide repeat-like domain-containing protein n=2 Tax=Oceanicoccus sagamiensis TaxID=716816 RepID=A0A1X9NFU5_9GAMM|nr:hypothetical protein BST96_11395 [Oceanicoccus sagamiensis]
MGLLLSLLSACSSTPEQEPVVAEPEASIASPEIEEEEAEAPTRPFPADSFHDLLVAEFAVRRNRYDLALGNYLQQAHQTRDPGVTARATRLAQFLGADKATLDAAQLWVELEPDNAEAQYTTATMLAKNQRPLEALDHMTTVLEQGGSTNFAAIAASTLSMPEATRNAAEARIDSLLVTYPDNTQLLTSKALLVQQRGEPEAALDIIREVLEIDDQDLHAVVVEARLLQQLNRVDEAYVRLEKVVASNPNNRRLRLQYARMLMAKDIAKAKQQFEILLSYSPRDPDLLLSLGLISKETQQSDDAKIYFQRLLNTGNRTTEANFYLGQLAEQDQDWEAAIDYYQQIPPGTDFLAATNRIVSIYATQGRIDTAAEYLQGLRQQYPEHSVRLYLLESELLLKNGRTEQAHALLTEALLISPDQPSLLYARSMLSERLDKLDLMEQDLLKIIAQDTNNATALNALGYVLANRSERLDEAYDYITRALAAKPGDPAIQDSLGWVEYRRGNLDKALTLLQAAYQSFPDHEVAAHLGEVLWQSGDQKGAIKIWEGGLKRRPDSPIIQETMERLVPAETPAK